MPEMYHEIAASGNRRDAKTPRKPRKNKQSKKPPVRKSLDESDGDPMDDFDVPDICLGGGNK